MSEHFPITPNEKDKNVLAPLDGQIAVMRLSNQFDESGRQIAYQLDEDGKTATTIAGVPEAYSDKVQEFYANKLAMDRNPTPEEMERGTPSKVITDLGDAALGSTVAIPVPNEKPDTRSLELAPNREEGMKFQMVVDEVNALSFANESIQHLPEGQGRNNINSHIIRKADTAYEAFKTGKINKDTYVVLTNTLLGAASSHGAIDAVVGRLQDARVIDADEMSDISLQASAINEIGMLSGFEADRARIGFANSLIAKSEYLLDSNDRVANRRYKAMVGFIAGLSTQINNPSTSNGFVSGALGQLNKYA